MSVIKKPNIRGHIPDISEQRFGRLLVKSFIGSFGGKASWDCLCDCGRSVSVKTTYLRSGHTKSCGCLQVERSISANVTHGMKSSRTYKSWCGMKNRCLNSSNPDFQEYGGRGISICDAWLNFENFYGDMGDSQPGQSLDRIDNSKGYSKLNCRWATQAEQIRNRRVTLKWLEKPLIEVSIETGIPYGTLFYSLKKYGDPFHTKRDNAIEALKKAGVTP